MREWEREIEREREREAGVSQVTKWKKDLQDLITLDIWQTIDRRWNNIPDYISLTQPEVSIHPTTVKWTQRRDRAEK